MLFNSLQFLIFLPIVAVLYFALSHKYRWILLLAASYYFYMGWKAEYAILIIATTLIDYSAGRLIGAAKNPKNKKYLLWISLAVNLGLLGFFKYFNFFTVSLTELFEIFHLNWQLPAYQILLPVGISFYTFQSLSYTIDVYRGKIEPEKNLGMFALYVSFFPQLVAGPIERAGNLLSQLYEKHYFDYTRVTNGLKLAAWGFFKKMVIADRLSLFVEAVYSKPTEFGGIQLITATIFFAFQIYCDFSGYSDIAIGTAQIFGIKLMDNFKRPYFSRSIAEFWKRWHISLSTWFKDYLYIPLGGNRVAVPRWYLNLFIVFVVSGLWHGANWTFVAWGALHGFYMVFSAATARLRAKIIKVIKLDRAPKLYLAIQVGITFVLVNIGWIFFRANSITDAFYILTHLFSNLSFSRFSMGIGRDQLYVAILAIIFMEVIHVIQEHGKIRTFLSEKPTMVRWSAYSLMLILIFLFGMFEEQQFIYFQF
jgi:alginate O-acetyltransferase complex protein AlgI